MGLQVLTIDQMEYLQKLGININTATCRWEQWGANEIVDGNIQYIWGKPQLCLGFNKEISNCINYRCFPAFTLQDLLELIPPRLKKKYVFHIYKVGDYFNLEYSYSGCSTTLHTSYSNNILDAAYDIYIWYLTVYKTSN